MENETKKRCSACASYECYYTKGFVHYSREKIGFCRYLQKITGNKDTCEEWSSNSYKRRRLNTISVKLLNETVASLNELADIVKEDIENKHIRYLARERLNSKLNAIEAELDGKMKR